MKLRAIRLRNVKKFGERGVALENIADGLNVLAADNEFGKSTIFEALKAGLFEPHSATNKVVKALLPYQSTSGPSVEIDLETDAGCFRIYKRFLSRKTATIVDLNTGQTIARAGDAELWLQQYLGFDKSNTGPAGLLWVAQGDSLEQPKPSKETEALLHTLLSQEVARVTGGDRLKSVQAQAQDRLSDLVTPKTGKPTGAYANLAKQKRALLNEITSLEAPAKAVEAAQKNLTRTKSELAKLQDATRISEETEKLRLINQQWQAASQAERDFNAAEKDLETLRVSDGYKMSVITDHKRALSDMTRGRKRQTELDARLSELAKKEKDARDQYVAAKHSEKEQRTKVTVLRAAVRRAHLSERLSSAQKEHARLTNQLKLAEDAGTRRAAAEQKRTAITVSEKALAHLETLSQSLVAAEAACAAQAVRVAVRYNNDTSGQVRVDGVALQNEETRVLKPNTEIEIDGIGRMYAAPCASDSSSEGGTVRQSAQVELDAALKTYGVSSVDGARAALTQKKQLASEIAAAEHEFSVHAPEGVEKLKAEIATLEAAICELSANADVAASAGTNAENLEAEETELAKAQEMFSAAERAVASVESDRKVAAAERVTLQANLDELSERFGSEQSVRDAIDTAEAQRQDIAKQLETKVAAANVLQAQVKELAALTKTKSDLEQAQAARQRRLQDLEIESARLEERVLADGAVGIGEALDQTREALEIADRKIQRFEMDRAALETLLTALERAERDAQAKFLEPVMRELRPLLQAVMPESNVRFSSAYEPEKLARGGVHEPFDNLSGGTKEQIAILSRLAFARLMAKRGREMPVILDDALVYSDDARISEMFRALQNAAGDIQLIVLSCRQTTFRALGGATIKPSAWLNEAA